MTTFDDRESAFENKFAHDEDLKFRAAARRNKRLPQGRGRSGWQGRRGDDPRQDGGTDGRGQAPDHGRGLIAVTGGFAIGAVRPGGPHFVSSPMNRPRRR